MPFWWIREKVVCLQRYIFCYQCKKYILSAETHVLGAETSPPRGSHSDKVWIAENPVD